MLADSVRETFAAYNAAPTPPLLGFESLLAIRAQQKTAIIHGGFIACYLTEREGCSRLRMRDYAAYNAAPTPPLLGFEPLLALRAQQKTAIYTAV